MKAQRFFIALTIINLGLTLFLLLQVHHVNSATVEASSTLPVLRGSSLEIVDDQGRVRASIKIQQGDPAYKWPDGKIGYPETVMFRLIDPKGRPEVKLGASIEGGGLGLIGEADTVQALLKADRADSMLKLADKSGKQQLIKP